MTKIPRILIIDDEFGNSFQNDNSKRYELCRRLNLKDVTGNTENIFNPVDSQLNVEAIFCTGQKIIDNSVENDIDGTIKIVKEGWEQTPRWSLILLDMNFVTGKIGNDGKPLGRRSDSDLNKLFGMEILETLYNDEVLREIPVVIFSAATERKFIEKRFIDLGAWTFFNKRELSYDAFYRLLDRYGLIEDDEIIGSSVELLKCLREARNSARDKNSNILILGQSGTGKELIAKYIYKYYQKYHQTKSNEKFPFVQVDLLGVPVTLIEDRLFGHKRNAFEGAKEDIPGPAEDANGGILFLDEFGDIPPTVQAKMLRLLDKNIRETVRIGDKKIYKVEFLGIITTERIDILYNKDFRSALLHRINASNPIYLPALDKRKEDIPLLVDYFISKYSSQKREVSKEALTSLIDYEWPGNIRQLEDTISWIIKKWPEHNEIRTIHIQEATKNIHNFLPKLGASQLSISAIPDKTDLGRDDKKGQLTLDELLKKLSEFEFSKLSRDDLKGKLPVIDKVYSFFLCNFIKKALKENVKSGGVENIQGTMKWVTGDEKMSATKSKRLLDKYKLD
jgi:DNA-binding NtrC family response regulator